MCDLRDRAENTMKDKRNAVIVLILYCHFNVDSLIKEYIYLSWW